MSNVSMMSLTPIGTPCSGPRLGPRSSARAWASASSGSKFTHALTTPSRAAIRATQSRTTASHVTSPAAILCAISAAPSSLSGIATLASIFSSFSVLAGAAGRGAGDLAEHRAGHQARAARIVEIEQAADQFARGIEAADRLIVGVEHFAVGVDAQAAEGEGDAARYGVAFIGRRVKSVRPIA